MDPISAPTPIHQPVQTADGFSAPTRPDETPGGDTEEQKPSIINSSNKYMDEGRGARNSGRAEAAECAWESRLSRILLRSVRDCLLGLVWFAEFVE